MVKLEESIEVFVLNFLFHVGELRKEDLHLLANSKYKNIQNGTKLIRDLLHNELIFEKEYKLRNGKDKTFGITEKGKDRLQDIIRSDYLEKHRELFGRVFRTPKDEKFPEETASIEKRLDDNAVLMMFYSFNIPVFTNEKPSLLYLRDMILGSNPLPKKDYNDNLTKEECLKVLKRGVYYSISEFMDFASKVDIQVVDTIYGTRARGIFLSETNCFPVFISKKSDNRLMLISKKGEDNLFNLLKNLSSFTRIYRSISDFDEYTFDSKDRPVIKSRYTTGPSALVFCDGDRLPYLIARENNYETKAGKLYSYKDETTLKTDKDTKLLFTANTMGYSKIYTIPYTRDGQKMLQFLSFRTEEELYEDEKSIYAKKPDIFVSQNTPSKAFRHLVVYKGIKYDAIFMPVFDAKLVNMVAKDKNWKPIFITFRGLINTIARSIGRELTYYCISESDFIDNNEVQIYNKEGNAAGLDMLYEYFKGRGQAFNRNIDGFALPKKFDIPYIEFYNRIARGEIQPEQIDDQVEKKPFVKPTKKLRTTKSICIYLDKNLYNFVHEYADNHNTNMSTVIDKLIRNLKEGKYEEV